MQGHLLKDPVILVKVLGQSQGYWNPTSKSTVACLLCKIDSIENDPLTMTQRNTGVIDGISDRVICVQNFRNNRPVVGQYYLAFRLGNVYTLDNQAAFGEYQ